MDRIIEIKVFGNHLTKDCDIAGVRGEANVTKLRITFDEGWDRYAKELIFWDAYGENPVRIVLTINLLENKNSSTRIYVIPIPAEPMARAGEFTFIIEGSVDGKKQRSSRGRLKVKDSPDVLEPLPPSPTELQQMQTELDSVIEDIRKAVEASKYAEFAQNSALEAKGYADDAESSAKHSESCAQGAGERAAAASKAASEAIAAKEAALTASEVATGAAVAAGDGSTLALEYAQNAGERAAAAELARDKAAKSAVDAAASEQAAEKAKESIENMRVASETLPAGSDASVTKTTEDGVTKFNFGIPQGSQGIPGVSGLPKIYKEDFNSYIDLGYDLPPYSETRDINPTTYLGLHNFFRNRKNPGNDMWTVTFTAGEGIRVYIPDYVEWAVAEPVFTAGYTYYLSFIPLIDTSADDAYVFEGKILGVWVAKEV